MGDAKSVFQTDKYQFTLYSKVFPSGRSLTRNFYLWCDGDEAAASVASALNSPLDADNVALANFAQIAARKPIYVPEQGDYELPIHYSPTNMKWVKLKLSCYGLTEDYQRGELLGSQYIVVPGVKDVDWMREALYLECVESGSILIPCKDGVMRSPDSVEVQNIESYNV